jgi:putative restriction endonuclease
MFDRATDTRIRLAAFEGLAELVDRHGDVLPRSELLKGFELDGVRVPLLSAQQGIFKPAVLSIAPLSILTSPRDPYKDELTPDGSLKYRYRGTDPEHRDNAGLRYAMQQRLPLIYFHGITKGKYVAAWPVFIVGDDRARLTFSIAVDDARHLGLEGRLEVSQLSTGDEQEMYRRQYTTAVTRVRLHQRAFRERVLDAYRRQCAFCRLRHDELLDAAHIIPDSASDGHPVVSNGLALCSLHHAAFDRYFIGIRPDYTIEVRPDLLGERDGPTLAHAIQGIHGTTMAVPSRLENRPEVRNLTVRYEKFLMQSR